MADEIADPIKDLAKSLIIDTIKEWYSYIKSYNDNMKELRDEYNNLVSLNNTFSNMVEQRKQQNMHKSTPITDDWLAKVHNLVEKDENLTHLIDEKTRKGKDQCCFGRVNCNLYRRYEMSKIAQIKVDEIKKVIKDKPDESMITEPRTDLIPTPNEFMLGLSSRVELMEIILKKLRDDYVDVVGIFGMGAIDNIPIAGTLGIETV
ncbi:uncharacterized protein LOC110687624 isoform X2 [Chenopodium quinoa]|uniref:Uncharacterized protein n=1 Tax=Chenopodium quinoa TaxID=63459 RepID=A0A803KR44_CHEQI|nr:uncharacterized protein LOC110687624 isoform X2 [Chenopodium quinoa]